MADQTRHDEAQPGYQPPWSPPYGTDGRIPPMPASAPYLGQPAGGYGGTHGGYGPPAGPYADEYGQPNYYGVPAGPKALSIASLCCGIASFLGFGFFLLPQLAAVVLGHLALNREPAGRAMAIAGLVLGYAALAITVLVVVILGVAFADADFIAP